MAKTNIEGKEIRCYFVNEKENSKIVIRSVDWISGDKHYPQLEKREFFKDEQFGWKTGKAKGFNLSDLACVQKNWDKIIADLGGKSVSTSSDPAPTARATQPEDAVPAANGRGDEDF